MDESTPTGWNNVLFPNVAMPNVLYEWQGPRRAHFAETEGSKHFEGFEQISDGQMTNEEFRLGDSGSDQFHGVSRRTGKTGSLPDRTLGHDLHGAFHNICLFLKKGILA